MRARADIEVRLFMRRACARTGVDERGCLHQELRTVGVVVEVTHGVLVCDWNVIAGSAQVQCTGEICAHACVCV